MKNTKFFTLFGVLSATVLFFACEKHEEAIDPVEETKVPTLSVTAESDSERMYEDGESVSEMTAENRRFEVARVLRITAIGGDSIEIANFAPVDIADVMIVMEDGDGTTRDLFRADVIGAHVHKRIHFPLNLPNDTIVSEVTFDYRGDSRLVHKLKGLQDVTWKLKMHDFNPNSQTGSNWVESNLLEARFFRMAIGAMINGAYIAKQPELLAEFKLDSIVGNDRMTFLTDSDKDTVIQTLREGRGKLNIGIVDPTGVVLGLANSTLFGVRPAIYGKAIVSGISDTFGHELGHVLGFSHASNMTYPRKFGDRMHGFATVMKRVWNDALRAGELPIRADEYYIPSDLPSI